MTSDKAKLKLISIGDLVNWLEESEEASGPVIGFRLHHHPDRPIVHSIIIGRSDREQVIPLRDVVARKRAQGTGCGTVSWR